jgi:predicted site-specific integrase-resolvase
MAADIDTTERFAQRTQVSTKTVKRWIKLGLPGFKAGRVRRILVDEALAWLQRQ